MLSVMLIAEWVLLAIEIGKAILVGAAYAAAGTAIVIVGGMVVFWTAFKIEGLIKGPERNLCVLGLPKTGKTKFLNSIKGKWGEKTDSTSHLDVSEAFETEIEGNRFRLCCHDIPGTKDYHAEYGESFVCEGDVILYFCNIYEYIKEENNNRTLVNQRLRSIYTWAQNNHVDKEKIFIIFTYLDKVEDKTPEEIEKNIITPLLKDKEYYCFKRFYINMLNEEAVNNLITTIFYGNEK